MEIDRIENKKNRKKPNEIKGSSWKIFREVTKL